MRRAFYANVTRGQSGAGDRYGGTPTHRPMMVPVCDEFGKPMGFLFEVLAHQERLRLPGVAAVQVFQSVDVDEGADFRPVVVTVPAGAGPCPAGYVVQSPYVEPHEISWATVDEPDEIPLVAEAAGMFRSKLGGAVIPNLAGVEDEILGQFGEDLPGLNFGRLVLVLLRGPSGEIYGRLV